MQLHYRPITEVGQMLRCGEITAEALTQASLNRIDRLNPRLNAFITVTDQLALQQARSADAELANGIDRGPLHGIPVAIKDLIATHGVRTTSGSRVFEHHFPDNDATVVTKLKQAGAVLLGKCNLHEFGAGTTGRNPFFGDIDNPWQAGIDPGGSSGGSAVAVSAGMAFAALGTDTGCSVREPAHCCGVVGFKPSFGRISKAGVQPLIYSMDHIGPITRSVQDAAIMLDAISGLDPNDPYSVRAPHDIAPSISATHLSSLKLGVVRRYFFECDDDIKQAINKTLTELSARGATIVELDIPDIDEAYSAIGATSAEAGAIHKHQLLHGGDLFGESVRSSLTAALCISCADYINAQHFRSGFRSRMESLFSDVDVLAGPTSPRIPARLSNLPPLYEDDVMKNTSIFNFTGHPSISVPCGRSAEGLPIGLMITGPLFQDHSLLHIAQQIEAVIDWPNPHPNI